MPYLKSNFRPLVGVLFSFNSREIRFLPAPNLISKLGIGSNYGDLFYHEEHEEHEGRKRNKFFVCFINFMMNINFLSKSNPR
jgi:hypothetical protein